MARAIDPGIPDRVIEAAVASYIKVDLATVMVTGIIKDLWPEQIDTRKADADYVIERLSELLDHDGDRRELVPPKEEARNP